MFVKVPNRNQDSEVARTESGKQFSCWDPAFQDPAGLWLCMLRVSTPALAPCLYLGPPKKRGTFGHRVLKKNGEHLGHIQTLQIRRVHSTSYDSINLSTVKLSSQLYNKNDHDDVVHGVKPICHSQVAKFFSRNISFETWIFTWWHHISSR